MYQLCTEVRLGKMITACKKMRTQVIYTTSSRLGHCLAIFQKTTTLNANSGSTITYHNHQGLTLFFSCMVEKATQSYMDDHATRLDYNVNTLDPILGQVFISAFPTMDHAHYCASLSQEIPSSLVNIRLSKLATYLPNLMEWCLKQNSTLVLRSKRYMTQAKQDLGGPSLPLARSIYYADEPSKVLQINMSRFTN